LFPQKNFYLFCFDGEISALRAFAVLQWRAFTSARRSPALLLLQCGVGLGLGLGVGIDRDDGGGGENITV